MNRKELSDTEFWEDMHELPEPTGKGGSSQFTEDIGGVEIPGFTENCPKCGGSGNWRPGYTCFTCKGKGKLTFKTSPDARGKARKYSRNRRARKVEEIREIFKAWLEERPILKEWIDRKCRAGSAFGISLYNGGLKYGHLTEGQESAVMNSIADEDDSREGFEVWCDGHPGVLDYLTKETENGNEFAGSVLDYGIQHGTITPGQLTAVLNNLEKDKPEKNSDLDVSTLSGYYAVPDGDTRLKVRVRQPGKNSKWYGWTFVDDGGAYGNRKTYGRQGPDASYKGDIQTQLIAILADPYEAQIAYGKLTGSCGVCGRILEDEESVAAGIGPICAGKL